MDRQRWAFRSCRNCGEETMANSQKPLCTICKEAYWSWEEKMKEYKSWLKEKDGLIMYVKSVEREPIFSTIQNNRTIEHLKE